jgi:hypothetical protein
MERVPQNNEQPVNTEAGMSRRGLLRGLAALGVTGVALERALDWSVETRPERAHTLSQFLRGTAPHERIRLAGKTYSYREYLSLYGSIADSGLRKIDRDSLGLRQRIAREFARMIDIESNFEGGLNSLESLERLDIAAEESMKKKLPIASSFGYAQIQSETARANAHTYFSQLVAAGILRQEQYETIRNPQALDAPVVRLLNLIEDESVLYGMLEFTKNWNAYGHRSMDGGLDIRSMDDSRGTSLAVSAYSAGHTSPRIAKLQTYIYEMALSNDELRAKMEREPIAIDGSRGPQTTTWEAAIAERYAVSIPQKPDDLMLEDGPGLHELSDAWEPAIAQLYNPDSEADFATLGNAISNRHSTAIGLYIAARNEAVYQRRGSLKGDLADMFTAFLDTRDPALYTLLTNPTQFEGAYGDGTFSRFWRTTLPDLQGSIRNDERYRGCIPTAYAPASHIGGDSKNVMKRVVLGTELAGFSAEQMQDITVR